MIILIFIHKLVPRLTFSSDRMCRRSTIDDEKRAEQQKHAMQFSFSAFLRRFSLFPPKYRYASRYPQRNCISSAQTPRRKARKKGEEKSIIIIIIVVLVDTIIYIRPIGQKKSSDSRKNREKENTKIRRQYSAWPLLQVAFVD